MKNRYLRVTHFYLVPSNLTKEAKLSAYKVKKLVFLSFFFLIAL